MLVTNNEPLKYKTEKQRLIAEYRQEIGYDLKNCTFMGKKYISCINYNSNHTMVINEEGYDIYIKFDCY